MSSLEREAISVVPCATEQLRKIVVIAASVGGVDALMKLIRDFPANLSAALVIVQHMSEGKPSLLPEILERNSRIQVQRARENLLIRAGTAFVAEPGKHLKVRNGRFCLDSGDKVRHVRPAADVLFTSAAAEFGDRVIGVVLTGSGSDGTAGCRSIKKAGGQTIAQDQESATFFQMPESAIKAQVIDYVLPLTKIADKIIELTN